MAIKTYKKGSNEQLSANFQAREFDCGCSNCKETPIDEKLVEYLQQIRDHFGKPIGGSHLTAYRCPAHNAQVPNAAKYSKHTMGMAADISISGVSPAEIAKFAESIGVLGIGLYDTDKDGHFVHIDTRTSKSFWFGHAQQRRTTFGGDSQNDTKFTITMKQLSQGDTGNDVRTLQILLNSNGCPCGTADGIFGQKTEDALKNYQILKDLTPDGIAGIKTFEYLLGVK